MSRCVFFVCIPLGVCWVFGSMDWFFKKSNLRKFWPLFLQICFPILSFWDSSYTYVTSLDIIPQVTSKHSFHFIQSFFPPRDLVWIIHIFLSSSSLKFSFAVSGSLANTFLFQILWYCSFQFLNFLWDFRIFSSKISNLFIYYISFYLKILLHNHNILLHCLSANFNYWIIWGLHLLVVFSLHYRSKLSPSHVL